MDFDYIKAGKNLRNARIRANLSLNELSEKLGIAKATLSRYENGKTKKMQIDMIDKICEYLHTSFYSIFEIVETNSYNFIKNDFDELNEENKKLVANFILMLKEKQNDNREKKQKI